MDGFGIYDILSKCVLWHLLVAKLLTSFSLFYSRLRFDFFFYFLPLYHQKVPPQSFLCSIFPNSLALLYFCSGLITLDSSTLRLYHKASPFNPLFLLWFFPYSYLLFITLRPMVPFPILVLFQYIKHPFAFLFL